MAADPRLLPLAISGLTIAFVVFVRDRRGAPPAPALDAEIPTGIELTVVNGGTIRTLRFGRLVLAGRSPSADLRIDDPRVSRLHARIELREDGVYVEDLGSRNGTAVGGMTVTQAQRLAVDDEVEIGPASIILRGVGAWR